jgi:iron(III) transport system substrate-binding protein
MRRNRLAFALLLVASVGCQGAASRVVLYCAQDQDFARTVLPGFEQQTGLAVVPHFDTEATKSVSLYLQIVDEASRPRCDVFWNNEILSTIRLQEQGLLVPHDSPAAADYPPFARSRDHTWTAFAARARVLIVNTDKVPAGEWPTTLEELTQPRWRGQVAIAKPLFGTTATQAACLFQVLGRERAESFYRGLKANGVQVVSGNKQVAEGVAAGQFAVGLTDTDDAIIEVEAGRPVAIVYPDQQGAGTLYIPNTVMIIKGGPNPEGARKLVDFLLSAEVEQQLAESASRQIPLNPRVKAKLPPQIHTPRTARAMAVDFEKAAGLWDEVQEFLRKEFTAP